MLTLGQVKTQIFKVLDQYSKNGVYLSPEDSALVDITRRMHNAIDMTVRKISVCADATPRSSHGFTVKGTGLCKIELPPLFICVEKLLKSDGSPMVQSAPPFVCDGFLYIPSCKSGEYLLIYRRYPESIEGASDSAQIELDEYLGDALVFGAAAELCERDDAEMYSRLKTRFDELMLNRYNVDKLSVPPYQQVFVSGKRRVKPWHS